MENAASNQVIGIVGFGEVGRIFSAALVGRSDVSSVSAYDRKFKQVLFPVRFKNAADDTQVAVVPTLESLCASATLLISAVTASNTLAVVGEAAAYIKPGTVFRDLNSASPKTKQQASEAIEVAGGRYVEVAVMSSVPPHGIKVPMLLGGRHAHEVAPLLKEWGMNVAVASSSVGTVSAIKMCRSIMIKGMEALVIESFSTALHYGVSDDVLNSLAESFPQIDWPLQGAYFFSRVVKHGGSRAEEMRESASTVREAGFAPVMAASIAEKIDWVSQLAKKGLFDSVPEHATWPEYAKQLMSHANQSGRE